MTVAEQVLALAVSRPPTLGDGRLVCLDGPAGGGKTSLAARVADLARAPVVAMDDLYAGWDGLADGVAQLDALLRAHAAGRPGRYRRWDWHASAYVGEVVVGPADLLVVEGVGSYAATHADLVTVLVWLTAPPAVRHARVVARDGAAVAPYLDAWTAAESHHHRRHATEARADLVVDAGA